MKPGWQTTEFWLTIAMQIIAMLVAFGVVSIGDRATIEGAISQAVESAVALITAAMTLWKYIQSRADVKREEIVSRQA